MLRIAIVEDDVRQAQRLEHAIKRYGDEHGYVFGITTFPDALSFLDQFSANVDLVFMDIMMPMLNGMDAARMLREKDSQVMIVFVTSMQQYALQGYSVSAFDFIVKPLDEAEFRLKFTRIMQRLHPQHAAASLKLKTEAGFVKLLPEEILYVEVLKHYCMYHTKKGVFRQYQTMKSAEEALEGHHFARCSNYQLVNLAYVTGVDGMTVHVGKETLSISHPRRKAFLETLNNFMERKPAS